MRLGRSKVKTSFSFVSALGFHYLCTRQAENAMPIDEMAARKKESHPGNEPKESFRRRLHRKLTNHFKFIVFDEAMFHEVFSLRLRPMNIVILLAVATLVLVGGTILLLRYTSLKTYVITDDIPALRRQTVHLLTQVDTLETRLMQNEAYLAVLRDILAGDVAPEKMQDSVFVDSVSKNAQQFIWASAQDSAFRRQVEQRQMEALQAAVTTRSMQVLSVPVRGAVMAAPYDPSTDHLWIDLSAPSNTPIFAVASGTIIYRDWTPESGNVLVISHPGNMSTVYKNVGLTQKHPGDRVSQGELIATTGLGASATSNPVVRFELWIDGASVDPQDYINFGM